MNVTDNVAKLSSTLLCLYITYKVTCDKIYQVQVVYFDQEISMWLKIYIRN